MVCDLPDVNVWLALLNRQHPHHSVAKAYWNSATGQRISFCRITMLGLLPLSINKVDMGGTSYTTTQAWQAYNSVVGLPEVSFMAEPAGIELAMQKLTHLTKDGVPEWTDAYLAAFASSAHLRMVSFDKGFKQYSGLNLLTLTVN